MKRFNNIDIKHLVVFDAVMRERSLTRAARHVGMSQPAVSLAMRRLRDLLDDRLFVRGPGGVKPTPRAKELAEPIHDLLCKMWTVLEPPKFTPHESIYTIQIAASDQCALLVLPELHERLRQSAPGISLQVRPNRQQTYVHDLDEGDIQIVMGMIQDIPERICHVPLFRDKYVCVMRADHPLAGKQLTENAYRDAEHITLSSNGVGSYLLDKLLERRNIVRNITSTIIHTSMFPLYLSGTDALFTAQEKTVCNAVDSEEFCVKPLPFNLGLLDVHMAWPQSVDEHPAHIWIRDQIIDICSAFK